MKVQSTRMIEIKLGDWSVKYFLINGYYCMNPSPIARILRIDTTLKFRSEEKCRAYINSCLTVFRDELNEIVEKGRMN